MGGRVEFEGFDELELVLKSAGPRARWPLFTALKEGAQRAENRAKRGIAKGPKTGRIYTQRFRSNHFGAVFPVGPRPPHQASAPGEYPAGDTGKLMGSIRHEAVTETAVQLVIELEANADYAMPLEFKPPEKGGRPFLGRALLEEAPDIEADAERRLRAEGLPG